MVKSSIRNFRHKGVKKLYRDNDRAGDTGGSGEASEVRSRCSRGYCMPGAN